MLEVVGNCEEISLGLVAQRGDLPQLRTAFRGQFDRCALTNVGLPGAHALPVGANSALIFAEFYPAMPYYRRFTEPAEFVCSPLKTLLAALMALPDSMLGIFQVLFQPASLDHSWHDNVRFLQDLEYRFHTNAGLTPQQQYAQQIPSAALTTVANWLETKAHNDKPFFFAVIRIAVSGGGPDREQYLRSLTTFLGAYQHGGRQLRAIREDAFAGVLSAEQIPKLFSHAWTHRGGILLSSAELASLVHLPPLSALSEMGAPLSCLGPLVDVSSCVDGTCIGKCSVAGAKLPVVIPHELRMAHVHIIGVPGKGKSTLIEQMCLQDIARGHGIAVLDPHGTLVTELLGLLRREDADRVVYLHFDDPEWIPVWNPLSLPEGVDPGIVADEIIRAFRSFITGWGDRLEHLLRHAILGLLHVPGSTMFDVSTLLSRGAKQAEQLIRAILAATNNELIHRFWRENFPTYKAADLAPPQHKLSKVLASGPVGAMLTQRDSFFALREVMDTGKILLVNLSNMGADLCAAVGSLVLSLIYTAAIGRGRTSSRDLRPFYLYADESHRFVTDALSNIIDETRKFKVGLTLAHHRYSQFPPVERDALSDCRTSVFLALNRDDSRRIARSLHKHVSPEDLMCLERGEGIAQIDGKAVRFRTSLPRPPGEPCCREDVIRLSHGRYYRRARDMERSGYRGLEEGLTSLYTGDDNEELTYDEF